MILEQKIIPYLAYEVGYCYKKHSFKHNVFSYQKTGVLTTRENIHNINNILPSLGKDYFLLLHPISDLSILVKEEFEKYDGLISGKANEEIINLFCEEKGVDELIENIDLKSLPYECIEFMFRNHYDVFGLIEQNLAISYNDL